MFKNIHLTKKVRSQDGSQFSEILTQIGHGKVRENDNIFNFLKSRDVPCDLENDFESWKMGEILYIVKDNKKREEINMRKLKEFKPDESIFCSEAKDTALDSDREANISNDVPYTQTGYLPKSISVKRESPVMLTQNACLFPEFILRRPWRLQLAQLSTFCIAASSPSQPQTMWSPIPAPKHPAGHRDGN